MRTHPQIFYFVLIFIVFDNVAGDEMGNNTDLCQRQLDILRHGLSDSSQSWSKEMILSSTNFSKKFIYGSTIDFGDFQRCMDIDDVLSSSGPVRGQYCLVQFSSKSSPAIPEGPKLSFYNYGWNNMDRHFGGAICLPASCSPQTVNKFIRDVLSETELVVADDYDQSDFCKTANQHNITLIWVTVSAVLAILIALTIVHTCFDVTQRRNGNEKPKKSLIAFSLYTNGLNLISLEQPPDAISCLDGAKVLSTLAIIGFHTAYHRKFFPLTDPRNFMNFEDKFLSYATFGFHYFVETFFVASGILASRAIMRELKAGSFSAAKLYFLRFMRLTPTMVAVILIINSYGSFAVTTAPYALHPFIVQPCQKYWWSAILYVQNYVNVEEICFPPSWYLSVDFQMYILAPIFVYLIFKRNKLGHAFIYILSAVSIIYHYFFALKENIKPVTLDLLSLTDNFFVHAYFPTHIRGISFMIGISFGTFIDMERKMNWVTKVCAWFLPVFYVGQCFASKAFFLANPDFSQETNAALLSSFRFFLALGIALAFLMCHRGHGGFINSILSFKYFRPFARICLCLYMIHPIHQIYTTARSQHPIQFDQKTLMKNFGIDLLITFPAAVLMHLLIEAPFSILAKQMISQRRTNSNDKLFAN